jgi:hypothetical protein
LDDSDHWSYYLKVKRTNLIPNDENMYNQEPLKVAINIELDGDTNLDKIWKDNEEIISVVEIENEVEEIIEIEV